MSKEEKIFTFRVNAELLDYLKRRADRNKRSIAKELEFIVENLYVNEEKTLENILKKIFAEYEKVQPENLKEYIEDDSVKSPLKDACLSLISFVKGNNI